MNSLEALIRKTNTKGELNSLRKNDQVPAIVYGGKEENQKISLSKKQVQFLIDQENFLSKIISLNIDGNQINVLPREVNYDPISKKLLLDKEKAEAWIKKGAKPSATVTSLLKK